MTGTLGEGSEFSMEGSDSHLVIEIKSKGDNDWSWFGSRGLHCYDLNGHLKWQKEFGQLRTANGFGEGNFKALFESIELDQIRRGVLQDKSAA